MYTINADGSFSMYLGDPTAVANLTIGYDVSAYNNNYTATVEVYLPEKTFVGSTFVTGVPIVSVKATNPESNRWFNGFSLKVVNYEGHPALTEGNYISWGNTWRVFEAYDSLAAVPIACASYADLGIKAGDWNTVKVIVEGDEVTYYINDVLAVDAVKATSAGNYFCLANNGDGGNPAFKNLVIKSNDGSVAEYKAFTVDTTPAGPADIEVVAIAGAMIVALMAVAFVMKARKA